MCLSAPQIAPRWVYALLAVSVWEVHVDLVLVGAEPFAMMRVGFPTQIPSQSAVGGLLSGTKPTLH